jgi:hypothetical protein
VFGEGRTRVPACTASWSTNRFDEPSGIDLEKIGPVLMADSPSDGDVLITSEGGRHFLSVVPNPHRLSLGEYAAALQIAKRWAELNNVTAWRTDDGVFTRLSFD